MKSYDAIIAGGGLIGSAIAVALSAPIADQIIGLVITPIVLKSTWESWQTIYGTHTR